VQPHPLAHRAEKWFRFSVSNDAPVKVAARGDEKEVAISVHNRGAPIPEGELATLFQAMKPAQENGAHDPGHLGLGLYIVEKIVSAHGGTVTVASSNAEGTTFTVNLPRHA